MTQPWLDDIRLYVVLGGSLNGLARSRHWKPSKVPETTGYKFDGEHWRWVPEEREEEEDYYPDYPADDLVYPVVGGPYDGALWATLPAPPPYKFAGRYRWDATRGYWVWGANDQLNLPPRSVADVMAEIRRERGWDRDTLHDALCGA